MQIINIINETVQVTITKSTIPRPTPRAKLSVRGHEKLMSLPIILTHQHQVIPIPGDVVELEGVGVAE